MCASWNGTTLATNRPVLIFHDEISIDSTAPFNIDIMGTQGTLLCRSQQRRASWNLPNGMLVDLVTNSDRVFQQIRNTHEPSFSQLSRYVPEIRLTDARYNGLWTCRRNNVSNIAIPVGIYHRGNTGGKWHSNYMQY